jgi:uncharacterized membrane protein
MTWLILALLSSVAAAFVAILAKLGLKNLDPTLATTIRSIIYAFDVFAVHDSSSWAALLYPDYLTYAAARTMVSTARPVVESAGR